MSEQVKPDEAKVLGGAPDAPEAAMDAAPATVAEAKAPDLKAPEVKIPEIKAEDASVAAPKRARPTIAAAEALLREAVSHVRPAAPAAAPVPEAIIPSPAPVAAAPRKAWLRARAPLAAGLAAALVCGVALGGGGLAAWHRLDRVDQHQVTAAEWKRIAARLEAKDEGGKAGDLKLLKDQLALVRSEQEKARGEAATRAAQLGERLDRIGRADKELGEKVVALADRFDRLDKDSTARVAALSDRLEKRFAVPASLATAAPAPVPPAPVAAPVKTASADPADRTGALPDVKPKPTTLDTWVLRDVFDGVAVIEGRNQRLVEVAPGESIPGGGRVEAIERRGKTWVVVTSKGIITSQAW